jgi:hypothetical protein
MSEDAETETRCPLCDAAERYCGALVGEMGHKHRSRPRGQRWNS